MRSIRDPAGIRVEPLSVGDARESAAAIIAEAEARAARIVADAERAIEHARERAARDASREARESVVATWASRVLAAQPSLSASERELATMAMEIARAVLDREASVSPALLEASARRALARVSRARTVVLRVHPDDRDAALERVREWMAPGAEPSVLEVHADEAVERGGVLVECELGNIDARLSSQLEAIARALESP